MKNGGICSGFTLLELMVVIVIISILASLGYASVSEIIFASRAKETAQTIRTFTERALMDAKRQNKEVRISISGSGEIIAADKTTGTKISGEHLSQGFLPQTPSPLPVTNIKNNFNGGVDSKIRIGLSGIDNEGYFAACGPKGYCGGAVKLANENSLKAYIRKGDGKPWEAL